MAVSIEKIFTKSRFVLGPQLLILILYTPLGLILFTLRAFISLQLCFASLILPSGTFIRSFVLRVLYTVMGIIIIEKNSEKKDKNSSIIIANHITPFDHIAVSLVYPCISVSVYSLPAPLSNILCYQDFGMTNGRDSLKSSIRSYINTPDCLPVLLHPEGATTNGKCALMKYGTWAFEIEDSVLVVGLNVDRVPFLPISPSVLGGSWTADLFYMLFSPVTIYTIRYIGRYSKVESESAESFSSRVQALTASALNIGISNHTVGDKLEYIKRLTREAAMPHSFPSVRADIQAMAQNVKEVLPHLPIDMIERDLLRTRNIDSTISNFLEGNIPEPIPPPTIPQRPTPSSLSTNENVPLATSLSAAVKHRTNTPASSAASSMRHTQLDSLNMAATSFGKSASERMLSFQERKNELIERARKRYIEKHGLNVAGYNC